jgi:NADH-quinone oxidoreductase subunit J
LTPGFGSPEAVGQALFTRFLLPVELAALILLIGMVGAVVLAKGALEVRVPSPVTHPAEAPDEEAEARAPEAVAAP